MTTVAIREAVSIDGTSIVYRLAGSPEARPLVLLHGWAQSSQCWGEQVLAELADRFRVIAVDLRGHGYSATPTTGYDDPVNWAGDVRAVLGAEDVTGAVLLGWSYGGLVICDYLMTHGTDAVDGVVLVGAITSIGRGEKGGKVGAAMRRAIPSAMSEEPGEAIRALGAFGIALTGTSECNGAASQALLGASLGTPPRVRAALFDRKVGHDDLLRDLDLPVLVLHGTADSVVDVSAAEHAAGLLPNVSTSFWAGADHALFVEDPARFVADVSKFADGLA